MAKQTKRHINKKIEKYREKMISMDLEPKKEHSYVYNVPYTREELEYLYRARRKEVNKILKDKPISAVTGEELDIGYRGKLYDMIEEYKGHKSDSFVGIPIDSLSNNELKQIINTMDEALQSKTLYSLDLEYGEYKRLETFNKRKNILTDNGITADYSDFYDFLETNTYKRISEYFSSGTALNVFDALYSRTDKDNQDDVLDDLVKYLDKQQGNSNIKGMQDILKKNGYIK